MNIEEICKQIEKNYGKLYATFIENIYRNTDLLFNIGETVLTNNYNRNPEIKHYISYWTPNYFTLSEKETGAEFTFNLEQFPSNCGAAILHKFNFEYVLREFDSIDNTLMKSILEFAEGFAKRLGFSKIIISHTVDYKDTIVSAGYKVIDQFYNNRSGNDVFIFSKGI